MDKLSIIMINYNTTSDTIECIGSILTSNIENIDIHIVVVDNNSNTESKELLYAYIKLYEIDKKDKKIVEIDVNDTYHIHFIFSENNKGFSGGNNIGLDYANTIICSDYYWLLNNDTIIDKNAIGNLMRCSLRHKNSIIGCTILDYYNPSVIQCAAGFNYSEIFGRQRKIGAGMAVERIAEININHFDCVNGCSIFFDRTTFMKIGKLDEDYFIYYEELNLKQIAKKRNIDNVWCRDAIIWHKEGQSIGTRNVIRKKSDISEYYGNYSFLIYFYKYYRVRFYCMAILRFSAVLFVSVLGCNRKRRRILFEAYRDFFNNRKGITIYR